MNSLVGFAIAYGVIILVLVMGYLLQRGGRVPVIRTPTGERFFQVLLMLILCGLGALVTVISYSEFNDQQQSAAAPETVAVSNATSNSSNATNNSTNVTLANSTVAPSPPPTTTTAAPAPAGGEEEEEEYPPIGLALADGCIVMFGVLMIPTPRYTAVARLLRLSYERLIWLHTLASFLMFGLMIAHAVGMDEISGTGLPIAIASAIAMFPALFRRYKYKLFRIAHCFVLVAIGFVIIHTGGRVLIMMGPGLFLWGLDVLYRLRLAVTNRVTVRTLVFHPKNDLIELTLDWTGSEAPPRPAQFIVLAIPDIDPVPHTFSVASCRVLPPSNLSDGIEMMDTKAVPLNQASTATLSGETTKRIKLFIRRTTTTSWTGALAAIASASSQQESISVIAPPTASSEIFSKVPRIIGFHGELKIPLEACSHVILVAGGIGITPMMHLIETLALETMPHVEVKSLTLIWTGRSIEDVEQLGSWISSMALSIRSVTQQQCSLRYFWTKKDAALELAILGSGGVAYSPPPVVAVNHGATVNVADVLALHDEDHTVTLHGARSSSSSRSSTRYHGFDIECQRPDWSRTFDEVIAKICASDASAMNDLRVGCYICGPQPLTEAAAAAAYSKRLLVHSEAFEI